MLRRVSLIGTALLSLFLISTGAQTKTCVPLSGEQLVIYRAGSLTRAFVPLEEIFRCQTGTQVKDVAMGSVDAGRQITAGGQRADLYAPADYLDIDLLMRPAGFSEFNIEFAHGRMVLAYSEKQPQREEVATHNGAGEPAIQSARPHSEGIGAMVRSALDARCHDWRRTSFPGPRRI